MGDIFVFEGNPAFGQIVDSADDVEDGCLAGAIGPHDGEYRPFFDLEADVIDRPDTAKIDGDVFCFEKCHCTRSVFKYVF